MLAVPSALPLHFILVEVLCNTISVASFTVTLAVSDTKSASVTFTEYVPAARFEILAVVALLLQRYE